MSGVMWSQPAEWATRFTSDLRRKRYRTLRALYSSYWPGNLGFRSAPPQALCYRHAPRAKKIRAAFQLPFHIKCALLSSGYG